MPSPAKRLRPNDPMGIRAMEARNMRATVKGIDELIAKVYAVAKERNITDPQVIQRMVMREAQAWGEMGKRLALERIMRSRQAGRAHARELLKVLGLEPPSDMASDLIGRDSLAEQMMRLQNDYELLKAELIQDLSDALLGVTQVSEREAKVSLRVGTAGTRNHARQVAHAETVNPFRASALEQYTLVGVTVLEWYTSLDERVCDECRERHGRKYPIDRVPEPHFGCRCDLLPTDVEMYRLEEVRVPA
ncbi:MAG: Phage Mu protein F like protein [Methanomassiliicoccales archaeon PtaU1.Bin030]|nr:MAG: Phage Mu protein F like protein [Methanomassiliicoccales archaeon PtaU1.Bin030]